MKGITVREWNPLLLNADNLHRIAISNLSNNEHALRRWWHKKYRIPPKQIEDYTEEELYVEHLEDYYSANPKAIQEFLASSVKVDDWDGEIDPELERETLKRLERFNKRRDIDIKKYQTEGDTDLSDEAVAAILASVGKDLPGSRRALREGKSQAPVQGDIMGEGFDEVFPK